MTDLLAERQPTTLERHLAEQLATVLRKQTQAEDDATTFLTHRPDDHLVPNPAYLPHNNRLDALRLHQARLGREQSRTLRELHRRKRTPPEDEPKRRAAAPATEKMSLVADFMANHAKKPAALANEPHRPFTVSRTNPEACLRSSRMNPGLPLSKLRANPTPRLAFQRANPVLCVWATVWMRPPRARGGRAGSGIGANPGLEPECQRDPAPHLSEPARFATPRHQDGVGTPVDGSRPQTRACPPGRSRTGGMGREMDQVIGVDVGKDRLDVFCLGTGRRLAVGNDEAGVAELAGWGGEALFAMEASGGYERLAHRGLAARGLQAAIVNAKRVRDGACPPAVTRLTGGPKPAACWPKPTASMPRSSPGKPALGRPTADPGRAFARPAATPVPEAARAELA